MINDDYDELQMGNGILYLADRRSASWQRTTPDQVSICLEKRSGLEARIAHEGTCTTPKIAIQICRTWVASGTIRPEFVETQTRTAHR